MAESLLAKLVREHYDDLAESGEEFTLEDVAAAVRADPALDSASEDIVDEAIAGRVRQVDKRRTNESLTEQQSIFGDSNQVVPLGEGRRRRRGSMGLTDTIMHLALVDENERQIQEAAERERRRIKELLPYLKAEPITWDVAVMLWERDHGGES